MIDLNRMDTGVVHETRFPDGTPHIRLANTPVVPGWTADIRCCLRTVEDLWRLMSVANAVEHSAGTLGRLDLPYMMGGRYDRAMIPGDAVDLQVVADVVNGLGFRRVRIFEPHSDATLLAVRRSEGISCESIVRQFALDNPVLFLPDAGDGTKKSATGVLQVLRRRDDGELYLVDGHQSEPEENLLEEVWTNGEWMCEPPTFQQIRDRVYTQDVLA